MGCGAIERIRCLTALAPSGESVAKFLRPYGATDPFIDLFPAFRALLRTPSGAIFFAPSGGPIVKELAIVQGQPQMWRAGAGCGLFLWQKRIGQTSRPSKMR
jgi:hypothetical protein